MAVTKFIKLIEIAKELNVDRTTVYKWIEKGLLKSTKLPTGTIRIERSRYEEFLRSKLNKTPIKILIIDDQLMVLESIRLQIGAIVGMDFEIRTCQEGLAGLLDIGDFSPDLILMDYRLEGIDGITIAERVFANPKFADVPVILISGVIKSFDNLANRSNIRAFLPKPFTAEILEQTIRACLNEAIPEAV